MSHLGERLSALIDGELSHSQRDRVLAHLAQCEACRLEAAALRALKRRMRALGEATAGAALTDRLMALGALASVAGRTAPGTSRADGAGGVPHWPVRSLALTALVLLALGLPVAAFVAGGRQQEPGPSVPPPADIYMVQRGVNGTGSAATQRAASRTRSAQQRATQPTAAAGPPAARQARATAAPAARPTAAATHRPARRDGTAPASRPDATWTPSRNAPSRSPGTRDLIPLRSG